MIIHNLTTLDINIKCIHYKLNNYFMTELLYGLFHPVQEYMCQECGETIDHEGVCLLCTLSDMSIVEAMSFEN